MNYFRTIYSEDMNKIGSYEFQYKVSIKNFPEIFVISKETFKIEILSPCDSPKRFEAVPLENQEYTLTDLTLNYTIPAFIIEPEYCEILYKIEPEDPLIRLAFNFDAERHSFSFHNENDLFLAQDSAN